MKLVKIFSLLVAMSFMACNGASQSAIDVDKFEAKLIKTPNAQLIDVRTPQEFADGHLANAINYNVDAPDFEANIAKLDKSKPTFVYCLAGARSANAANILAKKGFKELYDMKGGYRAWSAAGKPIDNGKGNTAPAQKKSIGMTRADLEKLIVDKPFTVVDFGAKWCGPCKKLSPELDKIGKDMGGKLNIINIDVDENPLISTEFKVEALPTLIFFNKTTVLGQTLGWDTKDKLKADIEGYYKLVR